MSLHNIGSMLSDLGRREEARAASQEALAIRRRLAEARPDAFLPELATSLGVVSEILAGLSRRAEAAQAAQHALQILAPFVERYPAKFGELAREIVRDVLSYCNAASEAPDNALLERMDRALRASVL
jgi:hypothetical protein